MCDRCLRGTRNFAAASGFDASRRVFVSDSPLQRPPAVIMDDLKADERPSSSRTDPGLQSDRWSLHQQQFGGPHAGKLKKIGQSMDPKDLTIEVKYYESNHTSMVRVDLTHKPTGLKVSGESFADQKEAIHSRLYGELKGMVEKFQADAARIEKAIAATFPTEDEALVMEAFDFGQFTKDMIGTNAVGRGLPGRGLSEPVRVALCNVLEQMHDRLYGKEMVIAAEARTVPEPKASVPDAIEHSWNMYKLGQVSADHTAKEVFVGVLEKFAEWMAKPEPQPAEGQAVILLQSLMKDEGLVKLMRPDQVRRIQDFLTPEQPSSQVHPDSALPSRTAEEHEKKGLRVQLDILRKLLRKTPIHHSETRFDLAMQIDRLTQQVGE